MDTMIKPKIGFVTSEVEDDNLRLAVIPIDLIDNVPAPQSKMRQRSLLRIGQRSPIVVRPTGSGHYEIIDGRRRLANMSAAGLPEVKVLVEQLDDSQAILTSLVLNMSRSPSPMVEARLIGQLIEKGHTQQQVGEMLGVTQALISQRLGLLDLSPFLQQKLERGEMTLTAARSARKLPLADQDTLAASVKVTVKNAEEMLRSYQAEMIDLSTIDIPSLSETAQTTICLTETDVASLEAGDPVTVKINGKEMVITAL